MHRPVAEREAKELPPHRLLTLLRRVGGRAREALDDPDVLLALEVDAGGDRLETARLGELLRVARPVLPRAEVRAGRDDPRVDEARGGRWERLDRGRGGVPQLAAVPVGHGRVADVVVARRELARGALEEERRRVEGAFQHLAGRTDVVGREQPVLPRERGRVAGVVEERRERPAVAVGGAGDHERVVRRAVRVVAARVPLRVGVPEVPVGGEAAAALPVRDEGLGRRRLRLGHRVADLGREPLEVRRDQLRAGPALEPRVRVRTGMRVRQLDEELGLPEPRPLPDRRTEPELVGAVREPADVERDERQGRPVSGERREDGGGRRERPVDALRDVVRRRAPRAAVDPDRRRHVASRDAEAAVGRAEGLLDGGHA